MSRCSGRFIIAQNTISKRCLDGGERPEGRAIITTIAGQGKEKKKKGKKTNAKIAFPCFAFQGIEIDWWLRCLSIGCVHRSTTPHPTTEGMKWSQLFDSIIFGKDNFLRAQLPPPLLLLASFLKLHFEDNFNLFSSIPSFQFYCQ